MSHEHKWENAGANRIICAERGCSETPWSVIATLTAERDALKAAIRRYSEEIGCGCEPGNGYYTPEGVREWLDEPVVCILCASLRGDA